MQSCSTIENTAQHAQEIAEATKLTHAKSFAQQDSCDGQNLGHTKCSVKQESDDKQESNVWQESDAREESIAESESETSRSARSGCPQSRNLAVLVRLDHIFVHGEDIANATGNQHRSIKMAVPR